MAKKPIEVDNVEELQEVIADMIGVAFWEQFREGKKIDKRDISSIITTCINISNKFNKTERINYNDIKKELVKQLGRWQEEKIYPENTYLWKTRRNANGNLMRDGKVFLVKVVKWKGAAYETTENLVVSIDKWNDYNCEEIMFADVTI